MLREAMMKKQVALFNGEWWHFAYENKE